MTFGGVVTTNSTRHPQLSLTNISHTVVQQTATAGSFTVSCHVRCHATHWL